MSTTINQDVIKAREVVAGYKELNKGTVEEISYYDPVLRLRRFKKVSIDPKSKDFTAIYGKKKNEKKPKEATSKPIVNRVHIGKPAKPKKIVSNIKTEPKPRYVKVTERKQRSKTGFDPNSLTSKIYDMYEMGVDIKEIASYYSCERHYVTSRICSRKKALGIEVEPKKVIDQDLLAKLVKDGKTAGQIAKELSVTVSSVYRFIRGLKSDEQKEIEITEVFDAIKKQCKLNQLNYIYSQMITPSKINYKNTISIMDVYKYCNVLADRKEIIIPDEPISEYRGRKIELPIAQ